jgi:hypothetical protein
MQARLPGWSLLVGLFEDTRSAGEWIVTTEVHPEHAARAAGPTQVAWSAPDQRAGYLKQRFLSHRLLDDYDAIVDAACVAWNRLVAEVGRVKSLCTYPWIEAIIS